MARLAVFTDLDGHRAGVERVSRIAAEAEVEIQDPESISKSLWHVSLPPWAEAELARSGSVTLVTTAGEIKVTA